MDLKIIADSSADTLSLGEFPFASAPLKIVTAEKEYPDTADTDVYQMVEELARYHGRSSTSCPSPDDFLSAFGEAENVVCVTITSGLSGTYNAACIAAQDYEEQHPGRRAFVLDSLSTGPEMRLSIEKIRELAENGESFDAICEKIKEYSKHTGLIFMLESLKNLANNGRVKPIVAKAAGLLGIRLVCKASDEGTLEPIEKCRGEKRALACLLDKMKSFGYVGGKVRIGHVFNEAAANEFKEKVLAEFKDAEIEIYPLRALCSFYAEKGGMLIGFEKAGAV